MSPLVLDWQPQREHAKEKDQLNQVLTDISGQCKVSPDKVQDVYPCTPLQHGLIALSETASAAYVAQHVFKFQTVIEIEQMKEAWNTVFQRHSILRTRVLMVGATAMQVVLKQWAGQWGDCSNLESYLRADRQQSMQPGEALSRLAISTSHLVWSAHHSIYDGYSLDLILQDVANAYESQNLPARPSFRSFIQRAFHSKNKTQSEAYWRQIFLNEDIVAFPSLPNPTYRPQPKTVYEYQAKLVVHAPSTVAPATVVHAAWALVQSSHLGSNKITFGTTLSGRNSNIPGIENIVGPTLATVPVCLDVGGNHTVSQYLHNVQQYFTQIVPYQHIGIQNLKKLGPQAAAACGFQTLLAVHPAETQSPYRDLFRAEENTDATFFNYAITIQCSQASDGIFRVWVSYDDTLVPTPQMKRLVFQLQHVISQLLCSDETTNLRDLNLMSPQDLSQLTKWNAFPETLPTSPLDKFTQEFESRPQATAVCSWDGDLSYAELDSFSKCVSEYLVQDCDVGPEVIVPVCFHRSRWMIVAIMAILKAGGAFLLLDPIYPQKRLDYMIEVTHAKIILVSSGCQERFTQAPVTAAVIDEAWFESRQAISHASPVSQSQLLSSERAMYLVFTSGSTGQPKGIISTHASFYASAVGHIPLYGMNQGTRQLFFGSPAFDVCVYEIISTLMVGGCICVPSEEDRNGDISRAIQSMAVNLASFTSSYARHLHPDDVPSLKTLALVGEPLAKDLQHTWAEKVCLLNAYGPSECSVVSTVQRGLSHDSNPANIGRMVAGAAWLVDPCDDDRLVPIGSTGELLIEGPHIGRGYFKNPEKTATSFIFGPRWAKTSGMAPRRFYKTGDLVRYEEDGSLIFQGRKDMQVKIRGQRVEIAEIEYNLARLFPHAAGSAVELLRTQDQVQLVAFIFCGEGIWGRSEEPNGLFSLLGASTVNGVSDIKAQLGETLPHHMVPTRYQLWPSMPTMLSGKLDRRKLQAELQSSSGTICELHESIATFPIIETTNYKAIQLNKKILSLVPADRDTGLIDRDFPLSTLGLDSIQLINLVTYIRNEYDVKMTVGTLYDPRLTVTGVAAIIASRQAKDGGESDTPTIDLSIEIQDAYEQVNHRSDLLRLRRRIFLTGATGLLGSQILRQLLRGPSVEKVIVHVRATNAAKGLARVVSTAKLAKWWSPSYLDRIECWTGDLSAPQLGLQPEQWQILCGRGHPEEHVNSIIHNGAAVQWQAPYQALKSVNVESTIELLSAVHQWTKPGTFTFISGGLKGSSDQDPNAFMKVLQQANGYSQTKFVAEELVSMFARHQTSHKISIIRPGLIIGTEQEGIPNMDDFLWKLVQICVRIGGYPADDGHLWLAVADVEEVATATLTSTFRGSTHALSVVDIETGTTVGRFWELVQDSLGAMLVPMTAADWKRDIERYLDQTGESHSFRPLLAMLQESQLSFGVQKPKNVETIRANRISKNVQTLIDIGFLPSMQSADVHDFPSAENIGKLAAFTRSRDR